MTMNNDGWKYKSTKIHEMKKFSRFKGEGFADEGDDFPEVAVDGRAGERAVMPGRGRMAPFRRGTVVPVAEEEEFPLERGQRQAVEHVPNPGGPILPDRVRHRQGVDFRGPVEKRLQAVPLLTVGCPGRAGVELDDPLEVVQEEFRVSLHPLGIVELFPRVQEGDQQHLVQHVPRLGRDASPTAASCRHPR